MNKKFEERYVGVLNERKQLNQQIEKFQKLIDANESTIQELEDEV